MGIYKRAVVNENATNHWLVDQSSMPMTLNVDYKATISYDQKEMIN